MRSFWGGTPPDLSTALPSLALLRHLLSAPLQSSPPPSPPWPLHWSISERPPAGTSARPSRARWGRGSRRLYSAVPGGVTGGGEAGAPPRLQAFPPRLSPRFTSVQIPPTPRVSLPLSCFASRRPAGSERGGKHTHPPQAPRGQHPGPASGFGGEGSQNVPPSEAPGPRGYFGAKGTEHQQRQATLFNAPD